MAEKAGVSQATVSMILNRRSNVSFSAETVEKVECAARELGYELPHRKIKSNTRKEKLIVVLCPTLTSPYYVLLLQGIESVAYEKGYGVFTCNTQRDAGLEEKYLRMISTMDPQGIIYACNPHPDFQKKVEELARRIPLVIISNKEKTTTVDAINQDNTMVGRLMARHLLDLGHRDVAFITPPLTRRQWQRSRRVDGFVKEYEKEVLAGHVFIKSAYESFDRTLPKMDSEYSMGYQLTMELLKEDRNFTAIAGQNDMMALGAIDALDHSGVENMAVIFAGGDCVTGPATVIRAIAAGKVAARNIDAYLGCSHKLACEASAPQAPPNDRTPKGRVELVDRPARERKREARERRE